MKHNALEINSNGLFVAQTRERVELPRRQIRKQL